MKKVFAFFHLNLAYSAIAEADRTTVIHQCYWPLLHLIETEGFPLGIELSAWTLQAIARLDPEWVATFRRLLKEGQCELVGSGYTQIIGPLVPAEVNRWNQDLGLECYQSQLGQRPRLALVNEMAFSEGLIGVYHNAGYQGLIMEADNVRLALGDRAQLPVMAGDAQGKALPVLWTDSILFQKLQRYAHGDIALQDYLDYVQARTNDDGDTLCLYCNDAEVFDYRPGRFHTESSIHQENEWKRLANALRHIVTLPLEWVAPSVALSKQVTQPTRKRITSAAFPVPVKKQMKYNLSRWAVTGRNDLAINSACHRQYQQIKQDGFIKETAKQLCEHWASDYRTHIEAQRWQSLQSSLLEEWQRSAIKYHKLNPLPASPVIEDYGVKTFYTHDDMVLHVHTQTVQAALDLRRGLAIRSLAFAAHDFVPLVGTQLHGYFHSIDLGADFYSANLVAEYSEGPHRVTDLERVSPVIQHTDSGVWISADISLEKGAGKAAVAGAIYKAIFIPYAQARVQVCVNSSVLPRQTGRVRMVAATFLTQHMRGNLWYETVNGGFYAERFQLTESPTQNIDQGHAVSPIVSCTTGLGATEGWVKLGDANHAITVRWDPGQHALFPQLIFTQAQPTSFLRLSLSLMESDDTFIAGGELPDLTYWLEAE